MAVAPIRSGTLGSLIVVRQRLTLSRWHRSKEINAKLKPPYGAVITASELPLEIQLGDRRVRVLSALLTRLSWTGSPSFPDIFAHFAAAGSEEPQRRVRLHTAALKELGHRLNIHHAWGVRP
jgi:hypothetical protein